MKEKSRSTAWKRESSRAEDVAEWKLQEFAEVDFGEVDGLAKLAFCGFGQG